MMVMALLRQADLSLESQHLRPVFAELAVHAVVAVENAAYPLDEGVEHQRMIAEIGRLDDFDLGMTLRDGASRRVDPFHEHPCEEEVGEHDDAAEPEPDRLFERRLDEREGHAGIGRLRPAEAKTLPQHARDLRD